MKKRALITGILILALLCALINCGTNYGKKTFELKSGAYKSNERIPDKYCHGNIEGRQNISLPFNWINPPKDTQSYALIIHDPDGRNWIHWAVFNIPANCNEIAENASGNNMPEGSIELNNQFRTPGYGGPEPPRGSGTHRYIATLYALNTPEINDLGSYKSFTEINAILSGKIIAKAEIMGTYSANGGEK